MPNLSILSGQLQELGEELFGGASTETLGTRVYFRGLELFLVAYTMYFCFTWGHYIQEFITSVLLPLGLAQYIDVSFLFEGQLALLLASLVAFLSILGFLRIWRPAYLLALLGFHLLYVARYSLGEISHGSNLIGMAILGLGIATVAFESRDRRRKFVFGFLYFFIGLGYTSAAVCKLVGTGITWPSGQHLLMWIAERKVDTTSKFGSFDPNIFQDLVLYDYRFGTIFLVFGFLAELLSFLMWWKKYRYIIVVMVLAMHIGIVLTMNIFFHASTYLLILLAVPWHQVIDRMHSYFKSFETRQTKAA